MSDEIRHEMTGLLAAQVDSYAEAIEQRDLARSVACGLEGELHALEIERDALIARAEGNEERFRAILAAMPYFGDWDEWAPIAYDKIPVLPRMVMGHVYGRHDDSTLPYAYCALCSFFRTDGLPADQDER